MENNSLKILCFSPYSGIWQHSFPESIFLESLKKSGHTIYYVTCNSFFSENCVVFSAFGESFFSDIKIKKKICNDCISKRNFIVRSLGFLEINLNSNITKEEKNEIDLIVDSISMEDIYGFYYDGVSVGIFALYNFLIKYKKKHISFSGPEWKEYLTELKYVMYTVVGSKKILKNYKPDRVIMYNTLYSCNNAFSKVSEIFGIPVYNLHAGRSIYNRLNSFRVGHKNTFNIFNSILEFWEKKYKNIPCGRVAAEIITKNYFEIFKGKNYFVYSVESSFKKNIFDFFEIPGNTKVVTLTMSSYDELFSAQMISAIKVPKEILFSTQIEWVMKTISFFEKKQDIFLIVRVHPREMPNKRDLVKSEHAEELQAVLSNLPSNVRINWPEDNISLYEIADISNLFLNFISNVGKELSVFGIPVITYSPQELITYPKEINISVNSEDDYFNSIINFVNKELNFDVIRCLYRWYALEFVYSQIDVSDSIHLKENDYGSFFKRAYRKFFCFLDPMFFQKKEFFNRAKFLNEEKIINELIEKNFSTPLSARDTSMLYISIEEETKFIKDSVLNIAKFLFGKSLYEDLDERSLRYRILKLLKEI